MHLGKAATTTSTVGGSGMSWLPGCIELGVLDGKALCLPALGKGLGPSFSCTSLGGNIPGGLENTFLASFLPTPATVCQSLSLAAPGYLCVGASHSLLSGDTGTGTRFNPGRRQLPCLPGGAPPAPSLPTHHLWSRGAPYPVLPAIPYAFSTTLS